MKYKIDRNRETTLDKARYINKILKTNSNVKYTVLGILKDVNKIYPEKRYIIEFLESKNIKITTIRSIKNGKIKDTGDAIKIGDSFLSFGYGKYRVIDEKINLRKGSPFGMKYLIEFDEYNDIKYVKWCDKKEVLNGSIKNPFYPKRYGVGCIGELNSKKNIKIYGIWNEILKRCYDSKSKRYKTYGGSGVKVCDRWLNYSNFYNDYILIKNYDPNKRQDLDKDILQKEIPKNKQVYSPETCILISPQENGREMAERTRQKYFIMQNGTKTFIRNNKSKICQEFNISLYGVNKCFKGEFSNYKGWRFRNLTDAEIKLYKENNNKEIKFDNPL